MDSIAVAIDKNLNTYGSAKSIVFYPDELRD